MYDLNVDPGETNNLVNDHPELVEALEQKLQHIEKRKQRIVKGS
ncbi:hypothetical protein RS130_08715 [Paraglaciecola aquimarina]|uniref:N-sulphoglucosamine sulphohydrolase C-terminal domain-containing protein n=1 Tax=Paraglaciecola aquimarina TaxID=1235557 RepID=A0ABU3SVI4_9ALTE|nr:hypothetical protein [Paraglaciecola aquimarina]MDU0354003.1 hypothetical protein [Paraglaciecola aquimarina]